jgi:hypothetical protein
MLNKIKNKIASVIIEWALLNRFKIDPTNKVYKTQKLYEIGKEKFVGHSEESAIVFSVLEGDGSAPKFIEEVVFYK